MVKTLYIITRSFPPKNIVGALRPFRLAKNIAKKGWRVRVITCMPNARTALDYNLLNELLPGTEIHYINKGSPFFTIKEENNKDYFRFLLERNRVSSSYKKFTNRLFGIINEYFNRVFIGGVEANKIPFFINRANRCINKKGRQVVLTTSPPHSIHLAGLFLSRKNKIPWIIDLRDPWDYYTVSGSIHIKNPMERKLEYSILKNANAIISSTQKYTNNLIEKYPNVPEEKFFTITNCFDENIAYIKNIPDPKTFVISYTGIFYPEKDPFTFFRALRSWFDNLDAAQRYQNFLKVQLIGSNNSAVREVVKQLNLEDNVIFVDRVPHNEAIRLSKGSDMLLLCMGLGGKTRPGWLPAKLFEYLGCRIPILAIVPESEAANIIRKTSSGYVVSKENHAQIQKILKDEMDRKFSGRQNTEFRFRGVDEFSEEWVISKMIKVIEHVASMIN